jgi:diphthamide biosynthesis protein 7
MTLSDGQVSIAKVSIYSETTENASQDLPRLELGELITTQQHDLEAWCMTFGLNSNDSQDHTPRDNHNHGPITILSGGDDTYLRSTHISLPTTSSPSSSLNDSLAGSQVLQDRRIHAAGVTALLPLTSNLLITGSYDDHIRLLHIPSISASADGGSERRGPMRPQVLAELDLGGGVWRIKVLEENDSESAGVEPEKLISKNILLLVSCMHAGTRIVRLVCTTPGDADGAGEWEFRVEAQFTEHKSMNYGSDVLPRRIDSKATEGGREHSMADARQKRRRTIMSTSFYDKLMCLWHWEG